MSISYVLVLLGLGVFGCAVWALSWAIDDGQYDDVESHGASILEDYEIVEDELVEDVDTPPGAVVAKQPVPGESTGAG